MKIKNDQQLVVLYISDNYVWDGPSNSEVLCTVSTKRDEKKKKKKKKRKKRKLDETEN